MGIDYKTPGAEILLERWRETGDLAARDRLVAAASKGDADMVILLLKAGAHVNVEDSRGCTPLRWAARSSDAEMDKLLKEAGSKE